MASCCRLRLIAVAAQSDETGETDEDETAAEDTTPAIFFSSHVTYACYHTPLRFRKVECYLLRCDS